MFSGKVTAAFVAVLLAAPVGAQINILTNRYDGARTGANLSETKLTTANVNVDQFGKLYSYPVDGSVYAQPLYMRGVTINGTARNVLYVATMHDKVYAFDADSSRPTPLWTRDFTSPPSVTPVPIADIVADNLNVVGNVGIQSTPVIDVATGTIYLLARTRENGTYVQRLHALDIATGLSRPGSPVTIAGSVPGSAPDSTIDATGSRVISFNPKMQSQRAGLALTNGVVLISWAAHEDAEPYHGWIMGYDSSTLKQVAIFSVTPDFYQGGIWQGGRAPTIDAAGNVYFATGNGKWDGTRHFGNSLLKFSVSRTAGLTLLDYFTPSNEATLNLHDDDLSGSGFTLLPGTNLLLGGGKEGVLYLLDANNLGKLAPNDSQIVQKLPVQGGHVMGGPVFWNSATTGPVIYNWSEDDVLKAHRLENGRLTTPPFAQGEVASPGHPGGSLTVSANGSSAHSGIIWASIPTSRDGIHGKVPGILRAYDAETLGQLWTSEQNAARDRAGTLMKFVPPVVVNGRVYLPNHDGGVGVYGLLPATAPDFSVAVTPSSSVIAPGKNGTFSVGVSAQSGFAGSVSLTATGQPTGTTVAFSPSAIVGAGIATMTVSVPASAASGTFSITVTGRSGTLVRSAAPVVITTGSAPSGSIAVNFVGSSTSPMGAAETAGVLPQPNWNNAAGGSRSTPLALVHRDGGATSATVTWAAGGGGTWAMPITEKAGNARMMKGYLDTTSSTTTTVTVAGLSKRTYDVYVYADGDNRTYDRAATYTVSGAGITTASVTLTDTASTNFAGTFTRATNSRGNYLKFSINATGFTLKATPSAPASGTRRAPINGIQIVPTTSAPPLGAIGINFVGTNTSTMAATESAGVVPKTNWNNATGASRTTPLSVVDESGRQTSASVKWTSSGGWMLPITDQAGNRRVMKGYLDTSTTSVTTVTVAGLPAGAYDVYVYADGDNRGYTRTAAYRISGTGVTTTTVNLTDPAGTNFSGTFTRASGANGNYVKFTINAGGFTLTATPLSGTNTTRRAPVNAIQIVPR